MGLAVAIPLLLWVVVILSYSVNVPWFDDFDPFPDFLRSWIESGAADERFRLLFQPNNEHRMVVGKLVALLYYKLTGTLNITFIHIAGACFTLGSLSLIWSAFRKRNLNVWYFLPVPFLLFQFQYHLIFLWAICSMQHQTVVFFVILSMFLLSRHRFIGALLAALCATFAMSSGIFVWAAGAVILTLRSNYRQLGIWLLVAIIAVGLYFTGMSAQGNESSFDFLVKNPHLSVFGFFAFLGGLFDLFPEQDIVKRSTLPVIMGVIAIIWVAIWLYFTSLPWLRRTFGVALKAPGFVATSHRDSKGEQSFQEFLLGIMIFLLANALVIGILRPRFGFFVMIVSNYKLYPALFLVVTYLTMISTTRQVWQIRAFRFVTVVSVLIWGVSIITYLPTITERKKYLLANAYNQEYNGFGLGHVPQSTSAAYVDNLMKKMVSDGIYTYPAETESLASEIVKLDKPVDSGYDASYTIANDKIRVEEVNSEFSYNIGTGQYAFLRQGLKVYIFKLTQQRYTGRNIFRQYDHGSMVEIPFSSVKPGKYQLGIIKTENGVASGGILKDVEIQ